MPCTGVPALANASKTASTVGVPVGRDLASSANRWARKGLPRTQADPCGAASLEAWREAEGVAEDAPPHTCAPRLCSQPATAPQRLPASSVTRRLPPRREEKETRTIARHPTRHLVRWTTPFFVAPELAPFLRDSETRVQL